MTRAEYEQKKAELERQLKELEEEEIVNKDGNHLMVTNIGILMSVEKLAIIYLIMTVMMIGHI